MLEKLTVKDMFPNSILSIKNDIQPKVYSIQKQDDGKALRFLKFNSSFFDRVQCEKDESVVLEIKKIHKMIKTIPSTATLNIKTEDGKVKIFGEGINFVLNYNYPEVGVLTNLPFSFENGYPVVSEHNIKLDVCFKIKLQDFKEIADYSSTLKTNIYKFTITKKEFMARVGDLHEFSDFITLSPKIDLLNGENLEAMFAYGLKEISKTFDNDVTICTQTNAAGWFYEVGKEHVLGILIPPCIREV